MKLTNVQFMQPISLGGFTKESIQKGEGTVELLDFPWVRVTSGSRSRRTTVFNIKDCDDWAEPSAEEQAAAKAQKLADRERGKAPK